MCCRRSCPELEDLSLCIDSRLEGFQAAYQENPDPEHVLSEVPHTKFQERKLNLHTSPFCPLNSANDVALWLSRRGIVLDASDCHMILDPQRHHDVYAILLQRRINWNDVHIRIAQCMEAHERTPGSHGDGRVD